METKLITVIEMPAFLHLAEGIWADDERAELIDYVARNPESGVVIPETGGVRKLRWARAGTGKRGGARVIYFYYHTDAPVYMLLAYAKSTSVDLTSEQKQQVTKLTALIKEQHSAKGS